MQHIKHVFFDLDHTLWDFEANSKIAFEKLLKKHMINIPIKRFLKVYKPINHQYWKLFREENVNKEQLRFKRLKDTFDVLQLKISDTLIDTLSVEYLEELPNNNILFDDALDVLEYLSKKFSLHIITNGFREVQKLKLENSKIKHLFEVIVDSETVGVKKPNPKIFNESLSKAKALPSNSIMIGDNLEADVFGALSVGMKAIYCNFINAEKQEGVIEITTLCELKGLL